MILLKFNMTVKFHSFLVGFLQLDKGASIKPRYIGVTQFVWVGG